MMIQPHGARALVKRLPTPTPESSLVIIPETVESQESKFATVLGIGKLREGGFDIGDMVILRDYSGTPCHIEFEGERIDVLIVNEEDVLCRVEGL